MILIRWQEVSHFFSSHLYRLNRDPFQRNFVVADSLLDKREERIRRMFDNIAPYYDLLNHLLSFNIDQLLAPANDASGSARRHRADPRSVHRHGRSGPGLRSGGRRQGADHRSRLFPRHAGPGRGEDSADAGPAQRIRLVEADAQSLPFPDDHFQIVTVAFGLRNVTDTDRCLAEMVRVTQPGVRSPFSSSPSPRARSSASSIVVIFATCCRWSARSSRAARTTPTVISRPASRNFPTAKRSPSVWKSTA